MELLILVFLRLLGLALLGCMISFYFTPLQYLYRALKISKLCTFCITFWISIIYNFTFSVTSWDICFFISLISAFISIEMEKRLTKIKIDF
jgi:hypothetical protein